MINKALIVIIVVFVAVFVVFVLRGSEDRWMCVDGEWVKHGVPGEPMPTEGCGDGTNRNMNNQNTNSLVNCNEILDLDACKKRTDCLSVDYCGCTTDRYKADKCGETINPEDWCLCDMGGFEKCVNLECDIVK